MNQPHHEGEGLAACPFCGGAAVLRNRPDPKGRGASYLGATVGCTNCTAEVHDTKSAFVANAIAAWNTRRPTPAEPSRTGGENKREAVAQIVGAVATNGSLSSWAVNALLALLSPPPTPAAQDVEAMLAALAAVNVFDRGASQLLSDVQSLLRSLTADLAAREATIAEQAGEIARLTAERDEAINDRRAHADHVLRMAKECEDGMAALELVDRCWEAFGHPSNRAHLSLDEQIAADHHATEAAEQQVQALKGALIKAEQFIVNGTELGFIRMPETATDPAHETLPAIRAALSSTGEKG